MKPPYTFDPFAFSTVHFGEQGLFQVSAEIPPPSQPYKLETVCTGNSGDWAWTVLIQRFCCCTASPSAVYHATSPAASKLHFQWSFRTIIWIERKNENPVPLIVQKITVHGFYPQQRAKLSVGCHQRLRPLAKFNPLYNRQWNLPHVTVGSCFAVVFMSPVLKAASAAARRRHNMMSGDGVVFPFLGGGGASWLMDLTSLATAFCFCERVFPRAKFSVVATANVNSVGFFFCKWLFGKTFLLLCTWIWVWALVNRLTWRVKGPPRKPLASSEMKLSWLALWLMV